MPPCAYITRHHRPPPRGHLNQHQQIITTCFAAVLHQLIVDLGSNAEHILAAGCRYILLFFFLLFLHTFFCSRQNNPVMFCAFHLFSFVRFIPADKSQSIHVRRQVRRFAFALCSFSLPSFHFCFEPRMLYARLIRECRFPFHVLFRLLFGISIPLFHRDSTDAAPENSSRSTSTNSGLPPIVIICIVASGGTSLLQLNPLKKTCDLTVTSFPPAALRGKTINHQKSSSSLSDQSRCISTSAGRVSVRNATNTVRKHGSSRTCSEKACDRR